MVPAAMTHSLRLKFAAVAALLVTAHPLVAHPAQWDGFRNRLLPNPLPTTIQSFGYSRTNHAGGRKPGEIGGPVQRSTTPASYAMGIAGCSLDRPLSASGRMAVRRVEGGSGAMVGWFHADSRGWRTPNSLGFRVDGNGDEFWLFYEYGTRSGMTGGGGCFDGERYQTTNTPPFHGDGTPHTWSLDYEPNQPQQPGKLVFQVDQRRYEVAVPPEHKRDGAEMNRFGIWNVQIAGASLELFIDDLVIGDQRWDFDEEPAWIGQGNRARFAERIIRPFHDFGPAAADNPLSETAIGGVVFRDEMPSYYGLPVEPASLDDRLIASGRLVLVGAASDSGVYLGWFNSRVKQANRTPEHEARQPDLLALLIEGPSRVGHYVRPAVSLSNRQGVTADGADGWPVVRPDGGVHRWELDYHPLPDRSGGEIHLRFDEVAKAFPVTAAQRRQGAGFDRFGLFNLQSGGHQVEIYVDQIRVEVLR